jgi:hypothetical protein
LAGTAEVATNFVGKADEISAAAGRKEGKCRSISTI